MTETAPSPAENPRELDPEQLTALQPGLARLMPEVGARMWKAYYSAEAANWPLAAWQLRELAKLLRLGTVTRPKYRHDLQSYIDEEIELLQEALRAEDFDAFRGHFDEAVRVANDYHRRWNKPWILWRLPGAPPPDLDLTPPPATEGG